MSKLLNKKEFEALITRIIKEEVAKQKAVLLKEADESTTSDADAASEIEAKSERQAAKGSSTYNARKLESAPLSTLKRFVEFTKKFPKMASSYSGLLSRIEDEVNKGGPGAEVRARKHIVALLRGRDAALAGNFSRLADMFYDQKALQSTLSGKGRKGSLVDKELADSEEDSEYAGKLAAAADLKKAGARGPYDTVGDEGTDWEAIGKFLGISKQAASQSYEKIKEKLQKFQDEEFDGAEYRSIAEGMVDLASRLAFKSIVNAISASSTAGEDVEGILSAEIQNFSDTLLKVLKGVAKIDAVMSEDEKLFWSNLLTSALDMVLENEEVGPPEVLDMLYDTAEQEFFRGWDDAKIKQLSDTIREKRRELVFEMSRNVAQSAPEGVEMVKAAAPDIGAASNVILDNPEKFPEVVNKVADELRAALQELAAQNSQSAIRSIQDAISKSIFFPEAKRGRKPKQQQ
jgi:hypothetical protein